MRAHILLSSSPESFRSESKFPQGQIGSLSMTTNLESLTETPKTTSALLKTSWTLVKYSSTCIIEMCRNPIQNQGGTQQWHKLVGGSRPTEDYQLPSGTQHEDWRPWQSLADCAKKCRSTTDCTGVTLKTTLEKGKCEMVKEGWPGSEEIVTSNAEHSHINREYCESFQS